MPLPPQDGTLRVDVPSLFVSRCLTVSALADEITFNVCKFDRCGLRGINYIEVIMSHTFRVDGV